MTRKYLVDQIFSHGHLNQAKQTLQYTDLLNTSLHFADPRNPTSTKRHRKRQGENSNYRFATEYGIITCHDYQTLGYIRRSFCSSPDQALTALLGGFIPIRVNTLVIVLNLDEYIRRSVTVNMFWCRKMWSLASKAHMIAVTGVYYSMLGGAYCSLGKSNTKYAYKAGTLAIEQIKLAKRLKDPILECKCWLYFAEDLIQLGKLKKAKKIIFNQVGFIDLIQDSILKSLIESVIDKWNIAAAQANVPTHPIETIS